MVKPIIPAFFIDGQMEKNILQKLEVYAHIRITGLNGKKVKISAIAKKIAPSIRLLEKRCNPIIILIDREGRRKTVDKIIQELSQELLNNNVRGNIIIGVADRMIENWILADWDSFITEINLHPQIKMPRSFEGMYGKSQLKKYYPSYQETTDGVRLFCKSRASIIKLNSKSFEKFITLIMDLNNNCLWLTR